MRFRFAGVVGFGIIAFWAVFFVNTVIAQEWGKETWVAVYTAADEPGATPGYAAEGKKIAMDSSENIFVMGEADIPDRRTDTVIYMYNREDGSVGWRDVYNHVPASSPGENDGSVDRAAAMATDAAGNTYVAIISGHELYYKDYRVVVRKYGPEYKTGENPDWTYVYGSADDGDQEAYAIALDSSGNCYVAGVNNMRGMLFKVNSDGSPGSVEVVQENEDQSGWMYFHDLALDSSGNIYVCGQAQLPEDPIRQDNLVAKYDATGVLQWMTFLGDSNGEKNYSNLALSPDSSAVYFSGLHVNDDQESFWSVARFNTAEGEKEWHDYYQGSDAPGMHYPTSMTVDAAGDVIVAGTAANIATGADMTVVKYEGAASKNRMWEAHYSGDNSSEWEVAVGVGTDAADNIYVTGDAYLSEPYETIPVHDYATVKYAPDGGAPLSVFHYDYGQIPGNSEYPAAMVVAPSGTVAVTGHANTYGQVMFPMITVLYSGDEEAGSETPTRPVFIPVLHIQASIPSTAGEGTVTYTYEWTSSSGESVIHPDKLQAEDMVYHRENGIDFTPGETWTVTVTPMSGGLAGPSFTGSFTIGDSGSVLWGDKPGLGDAVHILQTLSGMKE
jgi:hypothetical protein